jgi:hypothetical protein
MPVFVTVPEQEWACGCRTVADELVAVCIVAQRREPTVQPQVERVLVRLAPTCYRLDQETAAAPASPEPPPEVPAQSNPSE